MDRWLMEPEGDLGAFFLDHYEGALLRMKIEGTVEPAPTSDLDPRRLFPAAKGVVFFDAQHKTTGRKDLER